MESFKDLFNIADNITGVIIKPAKIITKKIVDEVEDVAKDLFED